MSDQTGTGTVDQRLAQVEGQMQALLEVVASQAATIAALERQLEPRPTAVPKPDEATEATSTTEAAAPIDRTLGRRRLLLGGATATAAAAAAVVVGSSTPAAAANGGNLILGQSNNATNETALVYGGSTTTAFRVQGPSTVALVSGIQTGVGPAIKGTGTAGNGFEGESTDGTGVVGTSTNEVGVKGLGDTIGVQGVATSGAGVSGETTNGTGVVAYSHNGTGLGAFSDLGAAVTANGPTSLWLQSGSGRQAPILDAGSHTAGEVVIANDEVWLCVADGTPGTWRKIGGPATAGQFHVLPAPARIYDSRTGSSPAQGPKTKLGGNIARTLDCKVNSSGVPAGATAVALTVLLVNAANGNGNLTVWANGAARPASNTMVWGAGSGRYTSSTICALDAAAKLQVSASAATDLVLDVVGYYR